ncbi:transferase [Rhodovulum sulfidophilum]|nr:transferase [Rhodovulum sulfidophilum DSM 1374]ANB37343.1 transferase [Rhodovulum sulfidophilum]
MSSITVSIGNLTRKGVEVLPRGDSAKLRMPRRTRLEAPCSLKWTQYEFSLELGAFSYQVSGYCFGARIGRYCSFGEEVQIGRQDHPLTWASTSPMFYLHDRVFDLGNGFAGAKEYHDYRFANGKPPTRAKITTIGNDVWIGHGAMIRAGVTIGDGAMVAARSVVVRDVPPYAVVAGNPAEIKKFRLPPDQIEMMQRARWWRFAPWQLTHLDATDPAAFAEGALQMTDTPEFRPDVIDLGTGAP